MKIIAIVAAARNKVIGNNNDMPWHIRNDLRYFQRTTIGHTVLMGRKSLDSLGKPLKNRLNFVISRNAHANSQNLQWFNDVESAIHCAEEMGTEKLFITGGGEIYRQTSDLWQELYYTDVIAEPNGNILFPVIDFSQWQLFYTEHFPSSEEDQYPFTIKKYRRNDSNK